MLYVLNGSLHYTISERLSADGLRETHYRSVINECNNLRLKVASVWQTTRLIFIVTETTTYVSYFAEGRSILKELNFDRKISSIHEVSFDDDDDDDDEGVFLTLSQGQVHQVVISDDGNVTQTFQLDIPEGIVSIDHVMMFSESAKMYQWLMDPPSYELVEFENYLFSKIIDVYGHPERDRYILSDDCVLFITIDGELIMKSRIYETIATGIDHYIADSIEGAYIRRNDGTIFIITVDITSQDNKNITINNITFEYPIVSLTMVGNESYALDDHANIYLLLGEEVMRIKEHNEKDKITLSNTVPI